MNKKSFLFLALIVSFTFFKTAFGMHHSIFDNNELWHLSLSMGHTKFHDVYDKDGNSIAGRIAFGLKPIRLGPIKAGLETGVQNGNRMMLDLPQSTLDRMGKTDIKSTVKLMIDLLAIVDISLSHLFSTFVKGGIVYRSWHFDRTTVPSISRLNGELQAGLSAKISRSAKIVAYYQGIFSGNTGFKFNETEEVDYNTATVNNIPSQHGAFLGVEIGL